MSKLHEKSKFVEYLRETPPVNLACKKAGVSRATYYRWYKDDREFRESIQKVIRQGRANINDLAEATLIKMIKGENFSAIRFWLQHNNSRYVPLRTTYIEPVQHNHINLEPGDTCTYCGTRSPELRMLGDSFYEREIKEMLNESAVEAKKKKKLDGRQKRELQLKMDNKRKGIEHMTRLYEQLPEPWILKEIEDLKSGATEYKEHRKPGESPTKEKKYLDGGVEDVINRG